jgi:hypothetical protein
MFRCNSFWTASNWATGHIEAGGVDMTTIESSPLQENTVGYQTLEKPVSYLIVRAFKQQVKQQKASCQRLTVNEHPCKLAL